MKMYHVLALLVVLLQLYLISKQLKEIPAEPGNNLKVSGNDSAITNQSEIKNIIGRLNTIEQKLNTHITTSDFA